MQTVAKFEGVNGTFVIRKKEHPFPLFQKLWLEFWAKDKEPVLTFLPYIQEFPRKDYTSFLVFYDPERDYGLALTVLTDYVMLNVNEKFTYLVAARDGRLYLNQRIFEVITKNTISPDDLIKTVEDTGITLNELLKN